MPGVPRELAEHRIDVNKGSKPMKQRLRRFSPNKKATIKKEIAKLMAAGFIREIIYPDWLANPVLVQKRIWPSGAYASTIQISTNVA
jgi:hypothetical protein